MDNTQSFTEDLILQLLQDEETSEEEPGFKTIEECYEGLANAIVAQAVEDYRMAALTLKYNWRNADAINTICECEEFFRSKWFSMLTSTKGEELLERLREECDLWWMPKNISHR